MIEFVVIKMEGLEERELGVVIGMPCRLTLVKNGGTVVFNVDFRHIGQAVGIVTEPFGI